MEKSKSFKNLLVWQKSHSTVLEIYKMTKTLPKDELFGITSQIRRSSVSIAANIVEGFRKKSKLDKARFLNIAQGSLDETEYFLILIQDLNYADTGTLQIQLEEVSRMLNAYYRAVINDIKQ